MYAKHLTLCQMYRWNLISGHVTFCFLGTRLRLWHPPRLFPVLLFIFVTNLTWVYDSQGWQLGPHMVFKFCSEDVSGTRISILKVLTVLVSTSLDLVSILIDALIANSLMPWGADYCFVLICSIYGSWNCLRTQLTTWASTLRTDCSSSVSSCLNGPTNAFHLTRLPISMLVYLLVYLILTLQTSKPRCCMKIIIFCNSMTYVLCRMALVSRIYQM